MANWGIPGRHPDLQEFMSDVFIETGTWKGDGIKAALAAGFRDIWSIEIDRDLFAAALKLVYDMYRKDQARKRPQITGNISVLLGDSAERLVSLLGIIDPDSSVTYWLDAHYHGTSGDPDCPCPLLGEIEVIESSGRTLDTILIDDVRLFGRWKLTVEEIKAAIFRINVNYVFSFTQGHVADDVLVAKVR